VHTHGSRVSGLTDLRHPLDPLTPGEIAAVRDALADAGILVGTVRVAGQLLVEPAKADVAAWRDGQPIPRRVQSTLVDVADGSARDVVVLLPESTIERDVALPTGETPYGQPQYLFEEYAVVDGIVKADARWREAMRARGIDPAHVDSAFCAPLAPGSFDVPEEVGRRVIRSLTFLQPTPQDSPWAHPVEGLVVTIDLGARSVISVVDERQVPVPAEHGRYDAEVVGPARTSLKPIEITQPEGPSFTVDGARVRWEQWSFRVGFSMREGLVLHDLRWHDGDEERRVLHRASVPEMVVPYGDQSATRSWISYFDAGEYHLGKNANALELGCDCLGVIHYFDAHVAADSGDPVTIPQAICMHEEDDGILWKHTEPGAASDSRRGRRLVISSTSTIGNYDYGFFWYLHLDGTIQLEAKATGIVFCGADEPGTIHPHMTELAPGLFAPVHQHLFCARLDVAIDGDDNAVDEVDLVRIPMGEDNPRGNAFTWRSTRIVEPGGRDADPAAGRTWHIGSASRTNRLGHPTQFQLIPQGGATLLADPGSSVAARAAFATKALWVTAAGSDDDVFPSGMYPNQHAGGAGIPASVARGGDVDGADVVVWHTFGPTHIPRPEDWPVMPVDRSGFLLKPYGFLDRNPALDLPTGAASHGSTGCGDACRCDHDATGDAA
jgi:primary-amine oxidase